jgi:hypothetical protein
LLVLIEPVLPGEAQMTTLVRALNSVLETNFEIETLRTVAIFCGAGLVVSLLFATYGLDAGPGLF